MRHSEAASKGRRNKLVRHTSLDCSPIDTSRWYRAIPNTFGQHRSGKTRGRGLFPTARLRRWQILLSFHSRWWLGRRTFRISNQRTRVIVGCAGRVCCWTVTGNTQSAVTFRGSSEQRIKDRQVLIDLSLIVFENAWKKRYLFIIDKLMSIVEDGLTINDHQSKKHWPLTFVLIEFLKPTDSAWQPIVRIENDLLWFRLLHRNAGLSILDRYTLHREETVWNRVCLEVS